MTKTGHNECRCVTISFYRLEQKFLRICLIILDAELPLGSLYIVQRVLSCLSISCPKRIQILFSVALYFLQEFSSSNVNLVADRQEIEKSLTNATVPVRNSFIKIRLILKSNAFLFRLFRGQVSTAEFFSAVFDPISIKLGHMLYDWVYSCVP